MIVSQIILNFFLPWVKNRDCSLPLLGKSLAHGFSSWLEGITIGIFAFLWFVRFIPTLLIYSLSVLPCFDFVFPWTHETLLIYSLHCPILISYCPIFNKIFYCVLPYFDFILPSFDFVFPCFDFILPFLLNLVWFSSPIFTESLHSWEQERLFLGELRVREELWEVRLWEE